MTTAPALRRPAVRYNGGKWVLAPWIISHFPSHRIYVEPYGGGASVLLRKARVHGEVYNDIDEEIVNVFRVLRDPAAAERLAELVALTPFARSEFVDADRAARREIDDPVERARRVIFRSFAGHGTAAVTGNWKTGFRSNSKRSNTTPALDWARWPAEIPAFVERLRAVVIECRPALEILDPHDSAKTLFYVDPPYVASTRGLRWSTNAYQYEMTGADHIELAAALRGVEGMVVLSGYRCDLYDDLYCDWERFDRSAVADGARARMESLWLNPAAAGGRQLSFELPHKDTEGEE